MEIREAGDDDVPTLSELPVLPQAISSVVKVK